MLRLFGGEKIVEFKSPVFGKAVSLADVPDEVFAAKMVGDGIAFEPREGIVYAPVSGIIESVFPTRHAIGIQSKEGLRLIIHIGIDSVNLNGHGFESLVHENQKIKTGDKLMTFDINLLNEKAKSIVIPVIITNMDRIASIKFKYGEVDINSTVMKVRVKS